MMKNYAVIVAGGQGSRYQSDIPKQFTKINDRYIIDYTIDQFILDCEKVVVVLPIEYQSYITPTEKVEICLGGATRQDSVLNGLKYLEKYNPDIVLIHDAVRLLVQRSMIITAIKSASLHGSAVPVLPLVDSLWYKGDDGTVSKRASREDFLISQTPQVFDFKKILAAHVSQKENLHLFSDCAGVYNSLYNEVYTYEGSRDNIKLTTPEDLELVKFFLSKNLG